jgi:hypothetical protein
MSLLSAVGKLYPKFEADVRVFLVYATITRSAALHKMHTSIQEEGTGIGSELERFVSETRQRDSHFALAPIEYTKGLNYLDTRH